MQTVRKEPLKQRSIGITLVFESTKEKEVYWKLLNTEGRRPAAYILYLLEKEVQKQAHKGSPLAFRNGNRINPEQE
ncbi:hypothetical protein E4N72_05940 [Treponema vincentii]|uniref:hypothetical protein n=1 Tax=Treponema vincentii TaxID=69710 RepID=UPI002061C2D5|nr:hypothetical protein [Treponema vincentii]UTC46132.1 hypothetical protein E4N72_05940 [Treponema vincentii]DAN07776.1 MAG TPA: UPF0366 protein [Caudoviricetes sp.]